jgi:hypothetical protein
MGKQPDRPNLNMMDKNIQESTLWFLLFHFVLRDVVDHYPLFFHQGQYI